MVLPRRRGLGQPVDCRADVPALGGYSHAVLETEDRCYTLRLKAEKLAPSETAGREEWNVCEEWGGHGEAACWAFLPSMFVCYCIGVMDCLPPL